MGKIDAVLEILKKAQGIDGRLYETEIKLKEIPQERSRLKNELESEKAHLNELEQSLKKLHLSQKNKEGELAEKEANVKKLDGQLSQVKTNKEYAALQQEIASLKADNSLIEEDVIKILDELESASAAIKTEQERVKQIEKAFQAKEQELGQKEKELKDVLGIAQKEHDEIIGKLPPETKDLYVRILSKKEGQAMTEVRGEACGACQMRLRPQLLNEVMLKDTLVLCENCSRILFIAEPASNRADQ